MVVSPPAGVEHREAHQTAENLFETQSVAQIREVASVHWYVGIGHTRQNPQTTPWFDR